MIRIAIAASLVLAQAPDTARFEVASIKRNRSAANEIGGGARGSTYRRTNATLLTVLVEAHEDRFLRSEVIGGPHWLNRDRFDVVAKTAGTRWTPEMVVALLEARFQLRTHEEVRERDVSGAAGSRVTRRRCSPQCGSSWG